MKVLFSLLFLPLLLIISISASAQTPQPTTTPESDDGDIVKISTTLIQVDVTATDDKGNIVTDLKPENFEIFENGKKQEITNFSFFSVKPDLNKETTIAAQSGKRDKRLPPIPIKLKPEQVRRTIALVIDDLGLSFAELGQAKHTAKRFVNEQMEPNDLVGIISTSKGGGALQQFTSDKRILLMAIDKIKFSSSEVYAFPALSPATKALGGKSNIQTKDEINNTAGRVNQKAIGNEEHTQYLENVFTVGTLGSIRYLVNGMNELPGRKAIILFSQGFNLRTEDSSAMRPIPNLTTFRALKALTDSANRAGVILNTIDMRGLVDFSGTADDNPDSFASGQNFSKTADAIEKAVDMRNAVLKESQSSLIYLAKETGGRAAINTNGYFTAVQKAVNDLNGYYVLGYQPNEETFDPKKSRFNNLTIKVNRPGIKVSYRSGFFAVSDEAYRDGRKQSRNTVSSALFSPFGSKDIEMDLTSIFANNPTEGNIVRALLNIRAADLNFTDEPNGGKKALFEIYAYTFADNGASVNSLNKSYSLAVSNDDYQKMLKKGLIYAMDIPVKNPGAYQLRVALRDGNGGKIGATNQFIEVPNLDKNKIALSGLILQRYTPGQLRSQNGTAQESSKALDAQTVTATRKFSQGDAILFNYVIYNAKLNASNQTDLQTQVRILRDGQIVFADEPVPFKNSNPNDLKRVENKGAISLGKNLAPGDYILQIIVFDKLAKEKNQVASQWIDFEIVP